ncbi:hypothetical protein [Spirillospora sp. NPDC029432]|uniref:hypothetical protein n=1 Tax=Spirillospora sp. NPDC029432 TaxID=3154599 RepID=UPI0034523141
MPARPVPQQTREHALALVSQGLLIQAIKLVREATAFDLREAKEYVDGLQVEVLAAIIPPELDERVRYLVATGERGEAVKVLRAGSRIGRGDAKLYVEAVRRGYVRPAVVPGAALPVDALPVDALPVDNVPALPAPADRVPLSERVRAFERAADHASAVALVQAETGMTRAEAERFVAALD